jgi:hypothetical protein
MNLDTQPSPTEHEHEYLRTYIRVINGEEHIIYSGERDTDKKVMMCDCGAQKEINPLSNFDDDENDRMPWQQEER